MEIIKLFSVVCISNVSVIDFDISFANKSRNQNKYTWLMR